MKPFEEIMIVNPITLTGARHMKFYPIRSLPLSGFAAAEPHEEMGYVADPPPGFIEGGFAEYPYGEMGHAGEEEMGYVAAGPYEEVGYAGEEEMGYVGEQGMGYVAVGPYEEVGFAGEEEMGYVAAGPYEEMGYAGEEEMGYADEDDELACFGEEEEIDGVGAYFESPDEVEGYQPEIHEPPFSPRVIPTTRLAGFDGYVRPKSINPTAESIRPAEEVSKPSTEWFKPLW